MVTPVLAAVLLALLAAPVDHSVWDALLKEHVTDTGLVDYAAFARSAEFRSYLAALDAARLEGREERELTLDEVEHEIVRKQFQEPRIHFALVCAAVSCPPLRREAYAGDRLDAQLEEQARRFLGDREKNRVDTVSGTVFVSPIFVWYRDDFGGSDEALARYLARFWPQGPERDLLQSSRFRLRETDYDWRLNGVAKEAAPR
jgi:hypothetical protein